MVEIEGLKDKWLYCKDCKRKFIHTVEDQKKFGQKGWADPVRCRYCRRQKKILNIALKDNVNIGDEVKFSEVCDKCGRQFYTKFRRKEGENLFCDDCFAEIKHGDVTWVQGESSQKNIAEKMEKFLAVRWTSEKDWEKRTGMVRDPGEAQG